MSAKKPSKPRQSLKSGTHNVTAASHRKSTGQTEGQFAKDPKGRMGQYSGTGNPPLMKK